MHSTTECKVACSGKKQFPIALSYYNILLVLEYYHRSTLNLEKWAEQGLLWYCKYKATPCKHI